ncbi:hypothetical protein A4R26_26410 [Niastella populi]|uniref:Uncharacterized protein n=1 Tax=Niastella populi TaxID=550983 RepID=A0A1V9FCT0_9BACT|nr:hypothetical protein A4R26_26410 [Niastella populi]
MFFLNSQIPNVKDYILSKYGLVLITGMHPTFNLNIRGELIDTYTIDNPNPIYIEFEDSIVYSGICRLPPNSAS